MIYRFLKEKSYYAKTVLLVKSNILAKVLNNTLFKMIDC